jgi:microcystin-dependent protein
MADPYTGEIRAFAFTFPPIDWATCNGQLLMIQQNPTLYAILGTMYGGNGTANFGLPDLRDHAPIHWGPSATSGMNINLAQPTGTATVTLTYSQMPAHTHQLVVSSASYTGMTNAVSATALPARPEAPIPGSSPISYAPFFLWQDQNSPSAAMNSGMLAPAFTGGAHENRSPFQVLNFCICTSGNWPPRPN